MTKKFLLGKTPFIREVDEKKTSTSRMMIDLLIALAPIIIFGCIYNGIKMFSPSSLPELKSITSFFKYLETLYLLVKPFVNVFSGALFSFSFELLYFLFFKKIRGFKNLLKETYYSFAIIPGIFIALLLPATAPIWMIALGCFVANIIFKMLFGGFGHNIFNPALIAYAFVALCFSASLNSGYKEIINLENVAGATPLTNLQSALTNSNELLSKDVIVGTYGSMWNFFLGTIPGSLGETSALLCIVGFVYLVCRKVINWYVPTIYVGTTFIITLIISLINGYGGLWYPIFNVLSGGLLFGAVFMATEPVTTPRNPIGKIIYAFSLGVLTPLFRLVGGMPEGVATSILFMCLFTPLLDRFTSILRANKPNAKNIIVIILIATCLVGISSYTIAKNVQRVEEVKPEVRPDEESFIIEVDGHNGPIKVKFTYEDDKITSMTPISHNESVAYSEPVKEAFETIPDALISAGKDFENVPNIVGASVSSEALKEAYRQAFNKLDTMLNNGYVTSDDEKILSVVIRGHNGLIKVKFEYNGIDITSMVVTENKESIAYSDPVKQAFETIPGALVEAGKNFESIEPIADATVSCNALKGAYRTAYNYLQTKYVNGYIENDQNHLLKVSVKGHNGLIVIEFSYDENKNITSMVIVENKESIAYSKDVEHAMNTLPGLLVSAGKNYNQVENVANASVSSNALKTAYGYAFNYLKGNAVIEKESDSEIIAVVKGHNNFIRVKFIYRNTRILDMKPIKHGESVAYSDAVKNAFETIPGQLVDKEYNYNNIENIQNATVSITALKNAYGNVYKHILNKALENNPNGLMLDHNTYGKSFNIVVKGHNGPIIINFIYDENKKITSMTPVLNWESIAYLPPVKDAFEQLPSQLVEAGSNYNSVDVSGFVGATVSSQALKDGYAFAYNYLNNENGGH